ncbi:MAG: MBL fold metallo-hydrolase [Clostridia bacterium]|nr:MBL fold metallo-hydrolase [Clostridia bacterium]
MITQLTDSIWRYHDETGSTSYLVVGKTRAAMIDCGGAGKPVMPWIRSMTDLPVILLLTHAHPDHYGSAAEFDEVWLHEDDISALPVFEEAFSVMGVKPLDRKTLHSFADDHVFDLGGETLIACALKGHTPGSVVFVDEAQRCIFSGDAVGSGDIVLMSVPLAYNLSDYMHSLEEFLERIEPWADYTWHAGHYHQAGRGEGVPPNTPCRALAADMVSLCGALLAGEIQGESVREIFAPSGKARRARLGRAGIVFSDEQCK